MRWAHCFGLVGFYFVGTRKDYCVGFCAVSAIGVADHFVFAGGVALFGLGDGSGEGVASSHLGTNYTILNFENNL